MRSGNQKKIGLFLSVLNIILNTAVNFFLVPFLIRTLSDENYSIYKLMQSFSGPLIMLNLGISTVCARSVIQFRILGEAERRQKENTLAVCLLITVGMSALVSLIGAAMMGLIPRLYGERYAPAELELAKRIFLVFVAGTSVHILADLFRGCLIGHEKFTVLYGMTSIGIVIRAGLIVALLLLGHGALAVALVDLAVGLLNLAVFFSLSFFGLKDRPRLHRELCSKAQFLSIASYAFAVLLQAVINQVNSNMDIVILGTKNVGADVITMYSSAIIIYSTFNSLLTAFPTVFFPNAAKAITLNAGGEELTDVVIAPGRIQAVIALGVIGGFALFGKNFVEVWIGETYRSVWEIALMLMIPVSVPLIQNVCLAILDAKLKRLFRSVALAIMAGINVVLTLILVDLMGFWGAAAATVVSLVIGHVVLMNVYYQKKIGLNVKRMFREILRGILPCALAASLLCLPLALFLPDTLPMFLLKCAAFVGVYAALLWKFGLTAADRQSLLRRRSGAG